ncbi:MAG: helix-turn-helix domain-containing protein [Opitutaceae bacterium]|nr:helix-turn-helix domain-containing protein [Opitutaceae bacterium]
MPRRNLSLQLTNELDRWIKVGSIPQQVALRARIVRQAAEGASDKQIAHWLSVHPRTVALWRQRVRADGIGCVWEVGVSTKY